MLGRMSSHLSSLCPSYISPPSPLFSWPSTHGLFLPPFITIHFGHQFSLLQDNSPCPSFILSQPILSIETSLESESLCMAILHPNFHNCCLEPTKFKVLLMVTDRSSSHTSSFMRHVKHFQSPLPSTFAFLSCHVLVPYLNNWWDWWCWVTGSTLWTYRSPNHALPFLSLHSDLYYQARFANPNASTSARMHPNMFHMLPNVKGLKVLFMVTDENSNHLSSVVKSDAVIASSFIPLPFSSWLISCTWHHIPSDNPCFSGLAWICFSPCHSFPFSTFTQSLQVSQSKALISTPFFASSCLNVLAWVLFCVKSELSAAAVQPHIFVHLNM